MEGSMGLFLPKRVLGVASVLGLGILIGALASTTVASREKETVGIDKRALDDLLAKDAIRQQIYNYARAVDRLDRELGNQVWHPDGTVDMLGTYRGPASG